MKHLLLNSAMMPSPGNYSLRELSAADFGIAVKAAYLDGTLVSYIGYQQTADLIILSLIFSSLPESPAKLRLSVYSLDNSPGPLREAERLPGDALGLQLDHHADHEHLERLVPVILVRDLPLLHVRVSHARSSGGVP